jgi:hypothetical protein
MTIENECLRLEETVKKTTQAKENINTEITNLGGNAVETISEIPKELDNIIKNNFGKIGIFSSDWKQTIYDTNTTFRIPINVPAEYKNIYVTLSVSNPTDGWSVLHTYNNKMPVGEQSRFNYIYKGEYNSLAPLNVYVESFSNKELVIHSDWHGTRSNQFSVKSIIAIK